MKLRLFVPILLVVPALAACGGSSGAASAQAKAIASAEAQSTAQASSSPSADASDAPSSEATSADASSGGSSGGGSNTCPDQTIKGYKISNVLLTDGATCAQVNKVAASSQLAAGLSGPSSDFSVDGFNCDVEAVSLVSCDRDNSQAEINFVADKQ